MEKITSLLPKLSAKAAQMQHLTHLTFSSGEVFSWNHNACAISYDSTDEHVTEQLLHEFGHAQLNHAKYSRDIELLAMERDAWQQAVELSKELDIDIDQEVIDSHLDTYRDWLHARSLCPNCQATGIQTASYRYKCVACLNNWRVNDAKICQLRRWSTS